MSIGLIILIIALTIFGYILFFPLTVKIDTEKNQYYFRLPGVFGIRVLKGKTGWGMRYSILFLRFHVRFFKPDKHRRGSEKEHPKAYKGFLTRRFKAGYFTLAINTMRTFRLRQLMWSIDTGDYPLNARLIPVASFLNNDRVNLSVNFNDYNAFYVILRSYLARIIYIIIRYFMFNR
jgi:hypothetical protein